MRHARSQSRCSGFTLIELLVVIAIIAILAALLFPIYMAAKAAGRQAVCLSNLGQLGRAVRLYADGNDGRVPPVRNDCGESIPGSFNNWSGSTGVGNECRPEKGLLYPYVRNRGVYVCPSDKGKIAPHMAPQYRADYPISYTMNFMMSWRRLDTLTRRPWSTSDYGYSPGTGVNKRLCRVMLLIHEDRSAIDDGDFNFFPHSYDAPDDSHNDGTNVLYCDLHARWSPKAAIDRAIARQEWNPDKPF